MTSTTSGSLASLAAGLSLVWLGACDGAVHTRGCERDSDCEPGALCVDLRCRGATDGGDDPGRDAFVPPPSDAGPRPDGGTGSPDGAVECGETNFVVTETMEMVRVPPGVQYMHIKAWGSGGNGEGQCGLPDVEGGPGGYTEGVYSVVPGTEMVVIVGYPGSASTATDVFRFGWGAHGGGGLSGVFRGVAPITETDGDRAIIIAGGGGSAAAPGCNPGGPGNHPDAGGMPTMMGGFGADRDSVTGGGGGHQGGVGGGRSLAGRGGTGFVSPVGLLPDRSRMLHSEPLATVPPMIDDPDYAGAAGTTEVGGRVVIRYLCVPPPPLI